MYGRPDDVFRVTLKDLSNKIDGFEELVDGGLEDIDLPKSKRNKIPTFSALMGKDEDKYSPLKSVSNRLCTFPYGVDKNGVIRRFKVTEDGRMEAHVDSMIFEGDVDIGDVHVLDKDDERINVVTQDQMDTLITLLEEVDFATQTTLLSLEGKVAEETTLSELKGEVAKETTLSELEGKDFATEDTLSDVATESTLADKLEAEELDLDVDKRLGIRHEEDNVGFLKTNDLAFEGDRVKVDVDEIEASLEQETVGVEDSDDVRIDPATKQKQDNIITELQNLLAEDFATESTLSDLEGKDFATQKTLASLEGKDFATKDKQDSIISELGDLATQSTLADVLTQIQAEQDRNVVDREARLLGQLTDGTDAIIPLRESELEYVEDSITSGTGSGNAVSLELGDYRHRVDITIRGTDERELTVEIYDGDDWVNFTTQDITDSETLQVETVAQEVRAYVDDDSDLDKLTIMSKGAL